jgi:ABC-2 type transport system ATP-binding protein
LRDAASAQPVPGICFAQGADAGIVLDDVPQGGVETVLPAVTVTQGAPGQVLQLLQNLPAPTLLSALGNLPGDVENALTALIAGGADPANFATALDDFINLLPHELVQDLTAAGHFEPLMTVTENAVLAGIPTAQIDVEGPANALLFAGLGLRPAAGGRVELINDQVRPLRGNGPMNIDLVGVSRRVQAGDTLGLMLYGFHPYFINAALLQLLAAPVTVSGTVELPLLAQ